MLGVLYAFHILLCLGLILIVLIQSGKGTGLNMFVSDGMGQNMFGGGGGRTFFLKLTTAIAFAFMLTCVVLALLATRKQGQYQGVLSDAPQEQAPAAPGPEGQPPASNAAPASQEKGRAVPPAPAPVGKPGAVPASAGKAPASAPAAPKTK
jgi:preprotein translocase subunit SecG